MKKTYSAFFVIATNFLLLSCTQKVDFSDLNTQYIDKLVVDGMITTEKKEHIIHLYHSSNLGITDSSRMETGATISITDGDTIINLGEKQAGVYSTPVYAATTDKTYTLNIRLKNGAGYTASDYLYPSMFIDTIYSVPNGREYSIYIKAHSRGQGAAVKIEFYANDSCLTSKLKDKIAYAKGSFYEKVITIPGTDLARDTNYVEADIYSTSYQMYQYLNDVRNVTIWSTEIFSSTPANVRTNISNGGLGFFSASDVLKKRIVIVRKR